MIIDRVAFAKLGDSRIGSVCPSVCLSVCPSARPSVSQRSHGSVLPSAAMSNNHHYQSKGDCLCVCNQWAFAKNRADAVDRLLILLSDISLRNGKHYKEVGYGRFDLAFIHFPSQAEPDTLNVSRL